MSKINRATPELTRRQTIAASGAFLATACVRLPVQGASVQGAVVETTLGRVRGAWERNGTMVFRGIPYARSTAGRRFQKAEPMPPWAGVRDATRFGQVCSQPPELVGAEPEVFQLFASTVAQPAFEQGEDCLVLNVWTSTTAGPRRPVMVWLHGGGYASGAGSYPTYWGDGLAATGEAVVVTINHRLNAFGYLYLAEIGGAQYADSGNVGMLDIVEALRWVRDNIAAFGGDPGNITIFGQSGGGGKVTTLMAMPAANGLFHRAIAQSGIGLRAATPEQATATAHAYLKVLGIAPNQLHRLETLPPATMIAALAEVGGLGSRRRGSMMPVVDGVHLPRHPFDPDAPSLSRDIPLMIGCTSGEATLIGGMPGDFQLTEVQLPERLQQALGVSAEEARAIVVAFRADRPRLRAPDIFFRALSLHSFGEYAIRCAELKAQQGGAPVYSYLFDWSAPAFGAKYRAFHGVEHPFVFRHLDQATGLGAGPEMTGLEAVMSNAWLAFARSGNPNHAGMADWPAFEMRNRATMIFNRASHSVKDPDAHARLAVIGRGRRLTF